MRGWCSAADSARAGAPSSSGGCRHYLLVAVAPRSAAAVVVVVVVGEGFAGRSGASRCLVEGEGSCRYWTGYVELGAEGRIARGP